MANVRFIITNLHDAAYVSATSEALPASYTQISGRARPWRSVGVDEQTITAGLPSREFLDAVVLYRHNLSGTATARLELLSGTDVVYDTGDQAVTETQPLGQFRFGVDAWGESTVEAIPIMHFPFWLPRISADGYRITLNDPDNKDGALEVGRIIAGQALSPTFNADYGVKLEYQEFSENRRTEGGSLRTVGEGLARQLTIDLEFLSKYDRQNLSSQFLKAGRQGDIYVNVFPDKGGLDEAEYAFMARRGKNYAHTHNFYGNWSTQLTFVEV